MMNISKKKLEKLASKGYRHTYLREMTTGWIVHQIRALREQRDWSQARLGEGAGKAQSAIARIEDPSYGKWSVNTLLELAEAFDVALEVRFADWPTFLQTTGNSSPAAMMADSFDIEAFSTARELEDQTQAQTANVIQLLSHVRRPKIVWDPTDRLQLEKFAGIRLKPRVGDQVDTIEDAPEPTGFNNIRQRVASTRTEEFA